MHQEKRKSIIAAATVLALESYDFVVFLFLVRGGHFLYRPSKIEGGLFILDLILAFLARPVGGVLFARLADKYGKKPLLILLTYFMAAITLMFSFLPSQGPLMHLVPYVLILFRALQGMVFGSTVVISNTYFAELAPTGRRGLYSALTAFSQEIGTLLAILVSISFFVMPNSDFIMQTGWRIPFISGALSILVALHLRYGMMESVSYKESFSRKEPLKILFKNYLPQLFKVFLIVPAFSICFYLFRVFILNQSVAILSLSVSQIFIVSLTACFVSMFSSLLGGFLSDLVGRKPILLISTVGILLLSWPALSMIYHPGEPGMVFIRMLVAQIMIALFAGLYSGALAPLVCELFPAAARATGVGLTYNLAISLIAGSSPLFNIYDLYGKNSSNLMAVYLTLWAVVSCVVIGFFLHESHKQKLEEWQEK